ncbi:beta-1,3-galactosyltransferase 5-like [Paramuricea clavata]|uniref:Hexosyltransferase n=1 Tax=Paramuricea clavata TaxID=317549 RepID=A0A6S7JPN2_PARCT|nr:beta-1,3-galactosyltransferase 5-like [Paramuricea clavata]
MFLFKKKLFIIAIIILCQVWLLVFRTPLTTWLSAKSDNGSLNLTSCPQPEHGEKVEVACRRKPRSSKQSLNAANVAMMLKNINRTLVKFINNFRATKISENPVATTRKPTTKPSIDIFLVKSGAKGDVFRRHREAIRQTWGNRSNCEQRKALQDEKIKNLRWLLIFVVGKAGPNDDELNKVEARQHNDMLIGNITDNYINNVVKFYMGQVWASKFDIKYTLKTDDDVYVRIPRVLEYLVNAKFPRPFYGGMTFPPMRVHRVIGRKWTVSWKYFGEKNYPKYNAGAFFILSADLFNRLFNYVYIRKPFHTDDAYVGIAMRDFGVKIGRISSFVSRHDMNVFIHKAEDCKILRLDGFGHSLDPESTSFLHNRLKTLACGSMQIKC